MLEPLKQKVHAANCDLVRHGLVCLSWGNASGIDRNKGLVVIKPSGISYEELTPSCMVVVDLDGRLVEGELNPSTDTPTHLVMYRAWDKVGSIVHTHSTSATVFAQACRPIPCFGTTHADHFRGEVPLTRPLARDEVVRDYETNTGLVVLECFEGMDPMDIPAVLVANHASFTWGATPQDAVKNAVALEEVARMAMGTIQLNQHIEPVAQYVIDKHYGRKHGEGAYYGQGELNV